MVGRKKEELLISGREGGRQKWLTSFLYTRTARLTCENTDERSEKGLLVVEDRGRRRRREAARGKIDACGTMLNFSAAARGRCCYRS